jgi:hypothetical protein
MKITRSSIAKVSSCLLETGAKKATLFLAKDFVVKATMGLRPRKNSRGHSFLVTFGKPNYAERKFIAACIKAGEPIPVRKVQLKFFK